MSRYIENAIAAAAVLAAMMLVMLAKYHWHLI